MNTAEIADLFIRAAGIDSRLPINARPKGLKGTWMPFVHSEEDIKSRIKTGLRGEKLHAGDDPFNEWMQEYWDAERLKIKAEDVADWERCNDLIKLIASEENRRCLWAWSRAKADCLLVQIKDGKGRYHLNKVSFAKWCRIEGIHEMTGTRRKNRAIDVINQHLVRGSSPDCESGVLGVLPVGPVFEHISDMIGAGSVCEEGLRSQMDDTAFSPIGVLEARDFSWSEARNEARRQREAKKHAA